MRSRLAWYLTAIAALSACGDDDGAAADGPTDSPIDSPTDGPAGDGPFVVPTLLSQTGLYSDIATHTIAGDVLEFEPRWQLWSDGAVKRRWVRLPAGAQIDTTDMDFWSFPQGTQLWKEFSRGGRRIETRLLEKIGTADDVASWFMVSFQWNEAETEAMAVPGGVVDDTGVNDIPDRGTCRVCHGPNRNPSVVLGLQALQLDYDAAGALLDLAALVESDRLTVEPTAGNGAFFPLPSGAATDATTTAALGYLHGNCGGCHNARSELVTDQGRPVQLRLRTAADARSSWAVTPTYVTAVGVATTLNGAGTLLVDPANPLNSAVHNRMDSTGVVRMPPVGREQIDATAVTAIDAWINSLPPP